MAFQSKVCVITGGAGGIGRTLVRDFTTAGAKVFFIDTDPSGFELAAEFKQLGYNCDFFLGDISSQECLESFALAVRTQYAKVDILINNACISRRGLISDCSYDDFTLVLKVGAVAPYYLTKLFLPLFSEDAAIVNISSTRYAQSEADTESYTAAKGAITALTHAMAVSLRGKVRVNAIAPGWIDTTSSSVTCSHSKEPDHLQHPSARIGRAEDVSRAVFFLCNSQNSFINGQILVVDGGMSHQMIYHGDYGWEYHPPQNP